MQYALALTLLLCIPMLPGCDASPRSVQEYNLVEGPPSGWSMSPDDAILAAMEFCEREGIDLSAHNVPRMTCNTLDRDRLWCILYDGRRRIPGDHFMLLLNDDTGAVEYVPGE